MTIAINTSGRSVFAALASLFGSRTEAQNRRVTYYELVNLSERQLEDIGLTSGLVELAAKEGAASIREMQPSGAFAAGVDEALRRGRVVF